MNGAMRRVHVFAAILLAPAAALAGPKAGAPVGPPTSKTPSPCGVKILPLAVGNSWTYSMVPAPTAPEDQIKRISPQEPDTITVTVKSIAPAKNGDTTITLEEHTSLDLTRGEKDEKKRKVDEHTYESTITCSAKKFEISPESFFFSGEPGGYIGIQIDSLDISKGTSWQLTNGGIGDQQWGEDLKMTWTRVPTPGSDAKLGSGKLELERRFTPEPPESVDTKLGAYHAEKLGLITTGRVTTADAKDGKPFEMPAGWVSTIWVAPGAGVVQTLNPYQHMYQLSAATLK